MPVNDVCENVRIYIFFIVKGREAMQLLSAEKETWLAGDVRRLTLKIAAPSVAAMVASAFCSLLETLILGRSDA